MPEKSTFEGLFDDRLNTMPPPAERNERAATKQPITETSAAGRPKGKRSDPDYKQFSMLLRKATHKSVTRTLDEQESEMDVSDLVEHLLQGWLKRQQKKA
jgi:hypothetical protein